MGNYENAPISASQIRVDFLYITFNSLLRGRLFLRMLFLKRTMFVWGFPAKWLSIWKITKNTYTLKLRFECCNLYFCYCYWFLKVPGYCYAMHIYTIQNLTIIMLQKWDHRVYVFFPWLCSFERVGQLPAEHCSFEKNHTQNGRPLISIQILYCKSMCHYQCWNALVWWCSSSPSHLWPHWLCMEVKCWGVWIKFFRVFILFADAFRAFLALVKSQSLYHTEFYQVTIRRLLQFSKKDWRNRFCNLKKLCLMRMYYTGSHGPFLTDFEKMVY